MNAPRDLERHFKYDYVGSNQDYWGNQIRSVAARIDSEFRFCCPCSLLAPSNVPLTVVPSFRMHSGIEFRDMNGRSSESYDHGVSLEMGTLKLDDPLASNLRDLTHIRSQYDCVNKSIKISFFYMIQSDLIPGSRESRFDPTLSQSHLSFAPESFLSLSGAHFLWSVRGNFFSQRRGWAR